MCKHVMRGLNRVQSHAEKSFEEARLGASCARSSAKANPHRRIAATNLVSVGAEFTLNPRWADRQVPRICRLNDFDSFATTGAILPAGTLWGNSVACVQACQVDVRGKRQLPRICSVIKSASVVGDWCDPNARLDFAQ